MKNIDYKMGGRNGVMKKNNNENSSNYVFVSQPSNGVPTAYIQILE